MTAKKGDIVRSSTGCLYRVDRVCKDGLVELTDLKCGVRLRMPARTLAVIEAQPGGPK